MPALLKTISICLKAFIPSVTAFSISSLFRTSPANPKNWLPNASISLPKDSKSLEALVL